MRKKRRPVIIEEPVKKIRKKRRTVQPQINIGKLIAEYLMHSYLYYEENNPIVSDHEFDSIVGKLLENFDEVEQSNHIHKHLIDKQALESYTGFGLIGKFPSIVKISALELLYKKGLI